MARRQPEEICWTLDFMGATLTRRIGVVLFVAGASISLLIFLWSEAMNAVPLSIPVVLSPGQFQSPRFATRMSIPYRINIVFDTSIPSAELDCFIGMSKGPQRCGNEAAILNVKWQLQSGGRAVTTGSSADLVGASYSYRKIQRHIGTFAAKRGRVYTVDLNILEDGTRLSEAHPRLEIEPNLVGYEGWLLLAGLTFYVGLLGAAAGIGLILVGVFRRQAIPCESKH
jgi:hypothetical protein